MSEPWDHHERDLPPQDADDLLAFVPIATRAMLGLSEEQAVFDAAMAALSQSPCVAAALRIDGNEICIASVSMGESMMRAIEAFGGAANRGRRLPLACAPSIRRISDLDMTMSTSVPEICKEIFPSHVAGKVASLLGSTHSRCIGAPIHIANRVGGALLVIQHRKYRRDLAACTQLAESIGSALLFAHVLEAVKSARTSLGADHPAQHYLGGALRAVGQLAPNAPRSLAPGGNAFETLRPRMKDDSFSLLPGTAVPSDPESAPRARILLVEDEQRVRKSTIALLSGLGYAVEGIESGERAIALYTTAKDQRRPFDLVLMDQTLVGQMGGVETVRIMRSLDPDVRAIMLSGQADRESPEEMSRHGFLATINKPVTLEDLNAAIEAALA